MQVRALLAFAALLALGPLPGCTDDDPPPADDDDDDAPTPGPPDDTWMEELPPSFLGDQSDIHGGLGIVFDPDLRDPVTAMADCGALISACLEETQGDFDACVLGVAVCRTDSPWTEEGPCCPDACVAQFRAARDGGQTGFDAYVRTWALDGSCFPGVPERVR